MIKTQRQLPHRSKGETILEVLVAVVMLSSILISAFTILNRAISTNVNVKNRVIALNIAREGIEAVRNVRDTNWLKYSGDKREKWLCWDAPGVDCDDGVSVLTFDDAIDFTDGSGYKAMIVDFNETYNRYFICQTNENGNCTGDGLADQNLDLTTNDDPHPNYRLFWDDMNERYTHVDASNTWTPFHRQIKLRVENPYRGGSEPSFCETIDNNDNSCNQARLNVVSIVHWLEEGVPRRVSLETYLYDFLERTEY